MSLHFLIQSDKLCLSTGMFSSFTFNVISDMVGFQTFHLAICFFIHPTFSFILRPPFPHFSGALSLPFYRSMLAGGIAFLQPEELPLLLFCCVGLSTGDKFLQLLFV